MKMLAVSVLAVASLVATGCGSDDGASPVSTNGTTEALEVSSAGSMQILSLDAHSTP